MVAVDLVLHLCIIFSGFNYEMTSCIIFSGFSYKITVYQVYGSRLIASWMFIPVELGKRFFPRCSSVLDKLMDGETEPVSLGRDTPSKKTWFHDLQDLLLKAFDEDKEEFDRPVLSSSRRGALVWQVGRRDKHLGLMASLLACCYIDTPFSVWNCSSDVSSLFNVLQIVLAV